MPFEVLSIIRSRLSAPICRAFFAPERAGFLRQLLFLALGLMGGCSRNTGGNADLTVSTSALYGAPLGAPSKTIPRVRPAATNAGDWTSAPFSSIQTELSPATLYHS